MMPGHEITDETLVAYLDGALPADAHAEVEAALASDPALAERLAGLELDTDALKAGFDALLSEAPSVPQPAAPAANRNWRVFQAAAAVALFVIGMGAGWGLSRDTTPDWHQAVADYQVLYTTETLTASPQSEAQRAAGLRTVSDAIGLELTAERIAVDGLRFQRAQILEYEGRPLAQLVYLDAQDQPIAFCIMREQGLDYNRGTTEFSGMPAVTWRLETLAYIVIGPTDEAQIEATAEQLWRKMPG